MAKYDGTNAEVAIYLSLDAKEAAAIADALRQHDRHQKHSISTMTSRLRETEAGNIDHILAYFENVIRESSPDQHDPLKAGIADSLVSILEVAFAQRGVIEIPDRQAMIDDDALSQHLSGHVSKRARTKLERAISDWVDAIAGGNEVETDEATQRCYRQVERVYEGELARCIREARRER